MWQSLNKNGKLIIVSSTLLISIILFSIFRDNSQLVDRESIERIINGEDTIKRVFVDEPYIYIHSGDRVYKIAKEAIDLDKLFDKSIVEYRESSEDSIDTILYIHNNITFYIIYNIRKNQQRHEYLMEEQQKEAKSHISIDNNITPQIPTINFSNVAGVDDVKDELEEISDFLKKPQKDRDSEIKTPQKGGRLGATRGGENAPLAKAWNPRGGPRTHPSNPRGTPQFGAQYIGGEWGPKRGQRGLLPGEKTGGPPKNSNEEEKNPREKKGGL